MDIPYFSYEICMTRHFKVFSCMQLRRFISLIHQQKKTFFKFSSHEERATRDSWTGFIHQKSLKWKRRNEIWTILLEFFHSHSKSSHLVLFSWVKDMKISLTLMQCMMSRQCKTRKKTVPRAQRRREINSVIAFDGKEIAYFWCFAIYFTILLFFMLLLRHFSLLIHLHWISHCGHHHHHER